uniref:Uncharacterized protein n=1 Tax=Anguilla anguilla TaxID=7936 RepID=A0A0E9WVT7_ANGAN
MQKENHDWWVPDSEVISHRNLGYPHKSSGKCPLENASKQSCTK